MGIFSKVSKEAEQAAMIVMIDQLDRVYSNKSDDEYKMRGDITKSPVYDLLQRTIADLTTIKGVNKNEIDDLKKMFNALHRPNFKKIVTKYMMEKSSDSVMMTATFTVAYRTLINELSRIYTSTEATDKGFVYKPDKFSRQNDMSKFIKNFNLKIDSELTKHVRETTKSVKAGSKFKMESFVYTEGFVGSSSRFANFISDRLSAIAPYFREFGAWCRMLFPDVSVLNPISWFSNRLSNKYDSMVDKYHNIAKEYLETKKAYDEYMKKPAFRRDKKVIDTYEKMMKRYNIKMLNAKAAIRDFDQRSIKETIEQAKVEEERLLKELGIKHDEAEKKDGKSSSDTSKKTKKDSSSESESTSDTATSSSDKSSSSDDSTTESKPKKPASTDDDPFDF
jgi:hypothetical protein